MHLNSIHLRNNREWVNQLLSWYDLYKRDFPWRRNISTYHTWICEVLSQQTTMAVVVPRFQAFVETLPDLPALADVSDEVLRELWAGLCYYARARNLRAGAQYIVKERNGCFPESYEDWLKVPGVGPYTASVIASICFSIPKACVDGNVIRVIARLTNCTSLGLWTDEGRLAVQQVVDASIEKERPGDFNQAMMELGATVCQKQSPDCLHCPIQNYCLAYSQMNVGMCPPNKPRKDFVDVRVLALQFHRPTSDSGMQDHHLLVERASGFLSGTLGFPLLRCAPGRSPESYVEELAKCSGVDQVFIEQQSILHTITNHRLSLNVVRVCLASHDSVHSTDADPVAEILESCRIPVGSSIWVSKSHARKSLASSLDRKIWEKIS